MADCAIIEPPLKRVCTDDVLDLSRKSTKFESDCDKTLNKSDDDVILLSEDEDDRLLNNLFDEMEKENAPKSSVFSKSKSLLLKLENELRNEESTLYLLQQLRANQRSHSLQAKGSKPATTVQSVGRCTQSPVMQSRSGINQNVGRGNASGQPTRSSQSPAHSASVPTTSLNQSIPKVTKGMAIQALEQQCNGKKAMLRKHLERILDKVTLPRPAPGNGISEVAFVPNTLTNEFTALVGLEEIVNTIHDFDPSNTVKVTEQSRAFNPFACARCGTDFTPVWKRKRPGSSEVVCEACIIDSQRSGIHKAYSTGVSTALKQHLASEREIEHEYQEIVNSPAKLDAFIKDHERKLLATHQAQLAQQQQQLQQQTTNVSGLHNQRYHQQQGFSQQANFSNITNPRHAPTNTVSSASPNHMGMATTGARRHQLPNNLNINAGSLTLPIQQQQGHSAVNLGQQFVSQYQQLSKVAAAAAAAAAAASGVQNQNPSAAAAANLMMANPLLAAAAASTSQQAVAQQQVAAAAAVQQRLAAAAALSSFQNQQAQHSQSTSGGSTSSHAFDQFTQFAQMQALVMNSLLCSAAANGAQANSTNRQQQQQQQMQQAIIQYLYLLQQQQQQAAAAVQAQQQQQHQQINAAALQQLMGGTVGNPAACMTLLQNLWALNSASGNAKK